MRFSTLGYSIKQGVKNIWRNKMFSLASIATMGACIFLFGIFFAVVINFNYIVKNAETDVSMTVFFNEDVDQATIDEIGTEIKAKTDVVKNVSMFPRMRRGKTLQNSISKEKRNTRTALSQTTTRSQLLLTTRFTYTR